MSAISLAPAQDGEPTAASGTLQARSLSFGPSKVDRRHLERSWSMRGSCTGLASADRFALS